MKIRNSILLTLAAICPFLSPSLEAVNINAVNTDTTVANTDFVRTPSSSNLNAPPSATQSGGSYIFSYGGKSGVATVASGSTPTPTFSLTITNNTSEVLSSVTLFGSVAQLKGNSSSITETLTATVSGISGFTVESTTAGGVAANSLNINTIAGAGVQSTPLTGTYNATLSGFSLAVGASFTITWRDANDGGTDAMFGLSAMQVRADVEAPTDNDSVITSSSTNVALGRVMQTGPSPTNNVTLNKTGASSTTYSAGTSGDAAVSGNSGSFGGGAQSDQITVDVDRSTTGVKNGDVTIENEATTSNGPGEGSDDPTETISVSATVVADRQIDGTTNLGSVFVGATVTGTATLTTSGDSNNFTTVTVNGNAVTEVTSSGTASVLAGTSTTFDEGSDTAVREVATTFTQSGNGQSITADLNVTGEGLAGENAGATVTVQANVFQHALLAANDNETLGDGGFVTVFNQFSDDGGQRAAAVISSETVTGAGWSATELSGSSTPGVIAEAEEVTASVSFDSTNKLNGTHVGSLVVGFEDQAGIAGGGSLGTKTWTLSADVFGNTAQTGVAQVATVLAGNSFAGFSTTHTSGLATEVALRAGTATGNSDISLTFSDINPGALAGVANDAARVSDIVSLEGTGSDVIVLQLTYDDTGVLDESSLAVFWLADGSDEWTLATSGNTGAGALAGAYAMSYDDFLAMNGGVFDGAAMLGAYGVDAAGNTAWAVINHNSDFAVNVNLVPEPGTFALFAMGGALLCGVRRRYQARS